MPKSNFDMCSIDLRDYAPDFASVFRGRSSLLGEWNSILLLLRESFHILDAS
ncbi:hypothetical protein AB1J99_01480 [Bacillus bombysepticus]|uniref:hypothetical protein n=1 Tax=Bacillus cereus TaxID=1396 RepID=UPI001F0B1EFC|nr:hypothetical protein [Bacillus cereus]